MLLGPAPTHFPNVDFLVPVTDKDAGKLNPDLTVCPDLSDFIGHLLMLSQTLDKSS